MDFTCFEITNRIKLHFMNNDEKEFTTIGVFIRDKFADKSEISALVPYFLNYCAPMDTFCNTFKVEELTANVFRVQDVHVLQSNVLISDNGQESINMFKDFFETLTDFFSMNWTLSIDFINEAIAALNYQVSESLKEPLTMGLKKVQDEVHIGCPCGILPLSGHTDINKYNDCVVIKEYLEGLFKRITIDIYIAGALNNETICNNAKEYLKLPANDLTNNTTFTFQSMETYKEIEGNHIGEQDYLIYSYQIPENFVYTRWPAFCVFDGIMGSLPQSRLTKRFHESGLAYYAFSALDWIHGDFWILLGCNPKNVIATGQIINEEIDRLKVEEINMDELKIVIEALSIKFIRGINSNIYMHMRFDLECQICSFVGGIDQWLNGLNSVRPEDVSYIAVNLKPKVLYWSKGNI